MRNFGRFGRIAFRLMTLLTPYPRVCSMAAGGLLIILFQVWPFSVVVEVMLNGHHLTGTPESGLSTAAHYWYSTFPTSRLRIPIQVAAGGVGIYYLKESAKDIGEGSAVECWVDDNYSGAKFLENVASGVEAVPT
jgi:hypothetical protein